MSSVDDLLKALARVAPPVVVVDPEPEPEPQVGAVSDEWRQILERLEHPREQADVIVEAPDFGPLIAALERSQVDSTAVGQAVAAAVVAALETQGVGDDLRAAVDALKDAAKKMPKVVGGGGGGGSATEVGLRAGVNKEPVSTSNPLPVSVDTPTVQAVVATVTAAGDTTVHTPTAGKAIRLWWVSAINDPDESSSPLIKVSLGASELYRAYAVAHKQMFEGAADEALIVNLSGAASVAVTAHIEEYTP